jgi:hypothetical protein
MSTRHETQRRTDCAVEFHSYIKTFSCVTTGCSFRRVAHASPLPPPLREQSDFFIVSPSWIFKQHTHGKKGGGNVAPALCGRRRKAREHPSFYCYQCGERNLNASDSRCFSEHVPPSPACSASTWVAYQSRLREKILQTDTLVQSPSSTSPGELSWRCFIFFTLSLATALASSCFCCHVLPCVLKTTRDSVWRPVGAGGAGVA